MQLRFLGQTYSANSQEVTTVATQQTACFKGQKYQLRVPVQTVQSQPPQLKKYRGVTYAV